MATRFSTLSVSREAAYRLLTDYSNYPQWAVDVAEVTILDQEGDIVVVEFHSPELLGDKYVLELIHAAPDSILYQQVDQFGGRGLRGNWQLQNAPGGLQITGEMELRLGFWSSLRSAGKVDLILRRRLESLERHLGGAGDKWFIGRG